LSAGTSAPRQRANRLTRARTALTLLPAVTSRCSSRHRAAVSTGRHRRTRRGTISLCARSIRRSCRGSHRLTRSRPTRLLRLKRSWAALLWGRTGSRSALRRRALRAQRRPRLRPGWWARCRGRGRSRSSSRSRQCCRRWRRRRRSRSSRRRRRWSSRRRLNRWRCRGGGRRNGSRRRNSRRGRSRNGRHGSGRFRSYGRW
jgi:hypothetical protein